MRVSNGPPSLATAEHGDALDFRDHVVQLRRGVRRSSRNGPSSPGSPANCSSNSGRILVGRQQRQIQRLK